VKPAVTRAILPPGTAGRFAARGPGGPLASVARVSASDSNTSSPVAVITGAAGGLGRALVEEFLHQGWRVAAASHHPADWKTSATLLPLTLDVTSKHSVAAGMAAVTERWGRIDCLVNNAGLALDDSVARLADEDWQRVFDVNLKGAFLCSQAVSRGMAAHRDGSIVNIASFAARQGTRGQPAYAAAKAGLIGFTQSLARELGSRNVRVNAVLPGVLPTGMTADLTPDQWQALAGSNVLGRIGTLEEAARFIVFLAGMRHVSGQVFQLDSRIGRWT
jgi:3-oxoacyl-[acyl-carrier protein] reductase